MAPILCVAVQQDAGGSTGDPRLPRVGARVVVRRRLAAPDPLTGATLTDVVGEVVAAGDGRMTLATRRGHVTVAVADAVVVKEVPPAPTRRGAPHRALSVEDLQRVMVGAWPAAETATLGAWLLRATGGFTHRANSVMTAGDPGVPLAEAVDAVERWYAARGLPPALTVAGPPDADLAEDPLAVHLRARGYTARQPTSTLTAAVSGVAAAAPGVAGPPPGVEVGVSADLTDDWLAALGAYRPVDERAARVILTGSSAQAFATARRDGAVVGIGRLGVSAGWGGLAAMWVSPTDRGHGLGSRLLGALAQEAGRQGLRSLHLQVDADNAGALRLYRRRGFEPHHRYTTLSRPPGWCR